MKKILLSSVIFCSSATFAAPVISSQSNEKEQVGYSFGYLLGKSNANALGDLDVDSFMQGFKQGYLGTTPALTNEQMMAVLNQYKKQTEAADLIAFQQIANGNQQQGTSFLANNAKQAGIHTTKSGLQYQVLIQGKGKKPSLKNKVEVHYEGRLLDGTVFDSSIARDEPVTLSLNQVIKGWQEGLQLMSEGSTYRFFIPAKLAYGETGAGNAIPPNSTLIFDLQLIKVLP
ncbi:FKBP-type peptidyl-prolyl cis-trans isomerase [Acinetobacter qingfengensis]|uniref:Peptidyl-prolyl cis-trans isomerase n=1 Tax=Acinetobacter qingfengensis TaxID=1262585 RepID=A0A1E7R527_9GAMM|nr:FKBP-type peptidyl-prolyl cis-trans isomerase [Acinetobacter qingfengensis]KAA8730933.1 FKBP-type peptidyl-prolyl cis-trans isomerase [Acinetobacter qingfengensis]OEY94469.1 peptidylprolyl isomerase [Acinetobacter qingfengensis]